SDARSQLGDNLRALPRAPAEGPLPLCRRLGCRSRTLAGRAANYCAPRFATGAGLALVEAQSQARCCHSRSGLLCHGSSVLILFSQWPGTSVSARSKTVDNKLNSRKERCRPAI